MQSFDERPSGPFFLSQGRRKNESTEHVASYCKEKPRIETFTKNKNLPLHCEKHVVNYREENVGIKIYLRRIKIPLYCEKR